MNKRKIYEPEKTAKKRNAETNSIQNAVSDLLDLYQLKGKFKEMNIMDVWHKLLGDTVASRTNRLFIRDRKMYVKLESASLKNELMMIKSRVLKDLNEQVGEQIIDELIFL